MASVHPYPWVVSPSVICKSYSYIIFAHIARQSFFENYFPSKYEIFIVPLPGVEQNLLRERCNAFYFYFGQDPSLKGRRKQMFNHFTQHFYKTVKFSYFGNMQNKWLPGSTPRHLVKLILGCQTATGILHLDQSSKTSHRKCEHFNSSINLKNNGKENRNILNCRSSTFNCSSFTECTLIFTLYDK